MMTYALVKTGSSKHSVERRLQKFENNKQRGHMTSLSTLNITTQLFL